MCQDRVMTYTLQRLGVGVPPANGGNPELYLGGELNLLVKSPYSEEYEITEVLDIDEIKGSVKHICNEVRYEETCSFFKNGSICFKCEELLFNKKEAKTMKSIMRIAGLLGLTSYCESLGFKSTPSIEKALGVSKEFLTSH